MAKLNLDKYVVVSGVGGVHELVATRSNGVLFKDIKQNRTRFAPMRSNSFTPLATISVYVHDDPGAIPLSEVFEKMNDNLESHTPVDGKAHSSEQRAYFTAVVPNHDEDQVHINDIKKIVKWFNFMKENGMIEAAIKAAEEAEKEEAEENSEEETAEA